MLNDFEQNHELLRTWMDSVESNLQKPFSLNILNSTELRHQEQALKVRISSENEFP